MATKYTSFADLYRVEKSKQQATLENKGFKTCPLSRNDIENLANSYITQELTVQAKLFRVDNEQGAVLMGRSVNSGDYAGIVFPNIFPGQTEPREYRLRRDNPDVEYKNGEVHERAKYLSPPGRANLFYFVPGTPLEKLSDQTVPIIITEGEKKTLALWRLAVENEQNFLPLGLPGVWSWRGTIGKNVGPKGERRNVKGPVNDFDRIFWEKRIVYVLFDTNVDSKSEVRAARQQLAQHLFTLGAKVFYVDLPINCGVNGVDDLLAISGKEVVLDLINRAQAFAATLAESMINLTDLGNARRLIRMYGSDIRYCYAWSKWLIWDGKRWKVDDVGQIFRLAKKTVATIYAEAIEQTDNNLIKSITNHAKKSESERALNAMIALARSEPGIPVTPNELDANPFLLNVLNGTLDLKLWQLKGHERKDLITKVAPVEYSHKAKCEMWEKFLLSVCGDKPEIVSFLQRIVGYSLTGDISEEKLFFVHGPPAAGKSTFIEALKATLGDYAATADFEIFLARRDSNGPRNDIARLAGARVVTSVEVDEGKRLAEGLVKMLTGGDTVTARFLYHETFEFKPTFKLWLAANNAPIIRDDDEAMWRRILRIPFENSIAEDKRDPKIKGTLRNPEIAGPGILAWAVEGCRDWQQNGLNVPNAIKTATRNYQLEMDPLQDFIVERCIVGDEYWVFSADIWNCYTEWLKGNGVVSWLSRKAFNIRLKERGCVAERNYQGRCWRGIGLQKYMEEN
jgi:putative DNA primase/helicase